MLFNKFMDMLNEKGYHYVSTESTCTIEIRYCACTIVIMFINNQCKIYKYDLNDNIVDESKWYKRISYAWKYILKIV